MEHFDIHNFPPPRHTERNHISNAMIEDISMERNQRQIRISYSDCTTCPQKQLILNIDRDTLIQDERGNRIRPRDLHIGMTIDTLVSSAMTRSIPPQTQAFQIRVVRRPAASQTTVGFILDTDERNRSITTISNWNPSSIIQFNTTQDTIILDRNGRNIPFSRLMPGQRVRVGHATFMTAGIPPQTTAFSIQLL